ncbi:DUF2267 domain-containing protein [Mesorhizobium sp. 128a]
MPTRYPTFDHAVEEANIWLRATAEQLDLNNQGHAYTALRATLHALRDRLPPESVVGFSAQLPMLIRGVYFEGWRLAGKPVRDQTVNAFCAHIAFELPANFPMEARLVACGIFEVIFKRLDPGEVAQTIDHLPVPLRDLWPELARRG